MCSITNLFDTNIKTFDAKKNTEKNSANHQAKLIFFKNKISVLEAEL